MPKRRPQTQPSPRYVMAFRMTEEMARAVQEEVERLHGTKTQVGKLALAQYLKRPATERVR